MTTATPPPPSNTGARVSRPGSAAWTCCGCRARRPSCAARWTTPRQTCSPAACSTCRKTPTTRSGCRSQTRMGRAPAQVPMSRTSKELIAARTRAEPRPASGGKVYHVYPPGFTGPKQQPAFAGLLEAYYMAALGGDWSRASPPRVQGGRHHPGARGRLPLKARSLFARDQFAVHHLLFDALGRHLLPDAGRNAGQAHRHSGRWRRRGDLRRRRQHRAVQPDGGRLPVLRRHYVPQHRHRHRGRPEADRRLEGSDRQALAVRGRGNGRAFGLVGIRRLLHRRQRPAGPREPDLALYLVRHQAVDGFSGLRRSGRR